MIPLVVTSSTTSQAIDCGGQSCVSAIQTPGVLTSTTATFLGSLDGSTFYPICTASGTTSYSVTIAASKSIPLVFDVMRPWRYVKIVLGSTETATLQAAITKFV